MEEFLQKLMESEFLNEDTKVSFKKELTTFLEGERRSARSAARKELAEQYKSDREALLKSMDQMIRDLAGTELAELREDLDQVRRLKVKMARAISEADARASKKAKAGLNKLHEAMTRIAKQEMAELAEDRKAERQAIVKQLRENKASAASDREKFVKNGAKVLEHMVKKQVSGFIKDMHEDIVDARKKDFGRRIYETFAAEYGTTFFSEDVESKKLKLKVEELQESLQRVTQKAIKQTSVLKKKLDESQRVQSETSSRRIREQKIRKLVKSLKGQARSEMTNLLEGIETPRLEESYRRYLPLVTEQHAKSTLSNRGRKTARTGKTFIAENVSLLNGDKAKKSDSGVVDLDEEALRKRAGIQSNGQ